MSAESNGSELPVGDRDLLRFYDGDLTDDEAAAVMHRVERDALVSRKLAGLTLLGDLVREAVAAEPAFDVADDVMARIDADAGSQQGSSSIAPPSAEDRRIASAAAVPRPELERVRASSAKPANENSRSIFALAACAAAAAAGLFVWGRMPVDDIPISRAVPSEPASAVAALSGQKVAPEPSGATVESGPGVEIASVDFGARQGSVFYMPNTDSAALTAIVWIDDSGTQP